MIHSLNPQANPFAAALWPSYCDFKINVKRSAEMAIFFLQELQAAVRLGGIVA
jgi:hypothetical protein